MLHEFLDLQSNSKKAYTLIIINFAPKYNEFCTEI